MKNKPASQVPVVMEEIIEKYGYKRNEMGIGEGFGEKALLEIDKRLARRKATAITTTDCEFMVIKREDFLKVTNKYDRIQDLKKDFLMEVIPFLNKINSKKTLNDLLYDFKFENLSINQHITRQGAIGEKIYLIYQGECRVEKVVDTGFNHFGDTKLKVKLGYIGKKITM